MQAHSLAKNPPKAPLALDSLKPGQVIDGRYRIESVLGEGTFAWVYLARHALIPSLQCAVKVLKPAFIADDELREQFRREAETIARLTDQHTVRVSDFGELPDGRPYICMEYCIGATLDRVLERVGRLDDKLVAHIAEGVLYSLREAHDHSIVHRDIKPSNISLTQDLQRDEPLTRVLDFGIAYVAQAQNAGSDNWDSDLVFCTPSYAAPEVLRGELSPTADLYALGLTLAELLDNETVFPNTGFYTVAARQMSPEPIPFGPYTQASPLYPILLKACSKELDARYQSASEMLEDIRAILPTLPDTEQLSWAFVQPEHCVGVRRCSLASDQLDIPLPAGCAMGTCNQANCAIRESHLRVPAAATPLDQTQRLEGDKGAARRELGPLDASLSRPLRMFEDKSGFVALLLDEGEFMEEYTSSRLRHQANTLPDQVKSAPSSTGPLPTFRASDFNDDEQEDAALHNEPTKITAAPAFHQSTPERPNERLEHLSRFTKKQRRLLRATDAIIIAGVIILSILIARYGLPF